MRRSSLAPLAAALCVSVALACTDTATRAIAPTAPQTDPVSAAALLPSRVTLSIPRDSVLAGDTLGGVTAIASDFSGKVQNQARIDWSTHAVDSAPGAVSITPVNPKAQQVTLKGLTRGRLMLVASYTDRYGQVARDSAPFHVAPRAATIGICLLDPHVADSLGIKGDTTVDYAIVAPFCIHNDTLWVNPPGDTSGADTTKAPPTATGDLLRMGGSLAAKLQAFGISLGLHVQVRVHVQRESIDRSRRPW